MTSVALCSTLGHRTACTTALTLTAVLFSGVRPAAAEPPLGSRSFLSRHVRSITELKRELDRDPRLIRIYSELLHMSPSQVRSEFSKLKLTRLRDEGVYKVYGASGTPGSLGYSYKVRRLPRGIDVFTLEDGATPVILKQCGNLLRGFYTTPGPVASSVPAFSEVSPDAGLPSVPGPSPEAISLETPLSSEWGWVEDTTSSAPAPDYFPPAGLVHSAARAWWPWLFPVIGLPFGRRGGGGGGTPVSSITPVFPGPVTLPVTVAPTPSVPGPVTPSVPGPVTLPVTVSPTPVVPGIPESPPGTVITTPVVPVAPESPPIIVVQPIAVIPEPSGFVLWSALGVSGLGFLLMRRRRGRL